MAALPRLFRRPRRIDARTGVVLVALALATGAAWLFIEVADEVREGETQRFDDWALRALRTPGDLHDPIGPAWLEEAGRDVTALGGVTVLVLVTGGVLGFLLLTRRRAEALLVLVSTGGGLALGVALKRLFDRPRPELVPHLSHVYTSSFPSGHAMMSAVVYLTLGALLAEFVAGPRLKAYVLALALALTGLVGVSRVYMGVHYPTDVLAGWSAGLVWALLCWGAGRWLRREGRLQTPPQG